MCCCSEGAQLDTAPASAPRGAGGSAGRGSLVGGIKGSSLSLWNPDKVWSEGRASAAPFQIADSCFRTQDSSGFLRGKQPQELQCSSRAGLWQQMCWDSPACSPSRGSAPLRVLSEAI